MGKDREFKSKISVTDYENITKSVSINNIYEPDAVFLKENTVIVFESSSTGDRKVHIGEMIQFITHIVKNGKYNECYFVLYLCGEGKTSPTIENEKERLQEIYNKLSLSKEERKKIALIAIADQFKIDFSKSLNISEIKKYNHLDL